MGMWAGVQGQREEGEVIFNYKGFSFCVNTPEKRHFNISGGNSKRPISNHRSVYFNCEVLGY